MADNENLTQRKLFIKLCRIQSSPFYRTVLRFLGKNPDFERDKALRKLIELEIRTDEIRGSYDLAAFKADIIGLTGTSHQLYIKALDKFEKDGKLFDAAILAEKLGLFEKAVDLYTKCAYFDYALRIAKRENIGEKIPYLQSQLSKSLESEVGKTLGPANPVENDTSKSELSELVQIVEGLNTLKEALKKRYEGLRKNVSGESLN